MLDVPVCPRCGYDLSGTTLAWTDRCPLEGVCNECGLELRWLDAFFPDRERVRGLFEHAEGRLQSIWWSIRTLWLVALPWRFWRRVTLAMSPRLGRIFAWPLVATVCLWAAASLASNAGYFAMKVHMTSRPTLAYQSDAMAFLNGWTQPVLLTDTLEAGLAPLGVTDPESWYHVGGWPVYLACLGAVAAWPLMFAVLSDSRRMGRIRWAHLLRATGYSLGFIPFLAAFRLVYVLGWCFMCIPTVFEGAAAGYITSPWGLVPYFLGEIELWLGFAAIAWVQVWWLGAIVRGFRLHAGWLVWFLLAIVSVISSIFTAMLAGAVMAMS